MKHKLRILKERLFEVFSEFAFILLFLVFSILLYWFFVSQTFDELIIANYGLIYYNVVWITQYILIVLLSLFLVLFLYKIYYFSKFDIKGDSSGSFASIIAILVSGCPACSITIASYIGLAGFLSLFPYDGLELKFLGIILLLYAIYSTLMTLHECSVGDHKKKGGEK